MAGSAPPDWVAFASAALFDAVLAGGLVGYGLVAEEGGPIVSGIGWLFAHMPRLYCRHASRQMPGWLGAISLLGGMATLSGLALAMSARALHGSSG